VRREIGRFVSFGQACRIVQSRLKQEPFTKAWAAFDQKLSNDRRPEGFEDGWQRNLAHRALEESIQDEESGHSFGVTGCPA
jgi:hypothetical protein